MVNEKTKKITKEQLKNSWEIAFYEGVITAMKVMNNYLKEYQKGTTKKLKELNAYANEINGD